MPTSETISTKPTPHRFLECCRKSSAARHGVKIAPLLALCVLLVSAPSCGPNVAQASRDLARKITLSLPKTTTPEAISPDAPRRVYLDASLSMKGFTSVEGNTTFGALVEGLGDDLPGCQLYKYGQKGRQPVADGATFTQVAQFGRNLRQPLFYDLDYNPDDRLLTQLAEEEQPAFSVLITDGVYSVPDGTSSPLVVEAIKKWLDRGYAFGIFIFKSPFQGTIYAENKPISVPHISVRERPFFAFVLSPSMRELNNLEQKLQQRIPETRAILFFDNSVELKVDFLEQTKGTYSFKRPPVEAYHWHMLNSEVFEANNRAAVDYIVSYRALLDYPVSAFRFDIAATYHRWNGQRFVEVKEGPPSGFEYKFDESKMQVAAGADAFNQTDANRKRSAKPTPNLRIFYPKDAAGGYGFYHIKLLVSPKSLRPDIQDISTRDDSDPANAGRTFRFYELVNALTEIHFNKRLATKTSPPLFVTISNG